MVHSIKRLIGYRLAALDGEIGHLKDFYFDARVTRSTTTW
jgi:hypothetical protein